MACQIKGRPEKDMFSIANNFFKIKKKRNGKWETIR
jgi:hypothetical protein